MEGHARGVQRHIAHLYSEQEDNGAFLYTMTDYTVAELKSPYRWMCKQLGKQPDESLLRTPTQTIFPFGGTIHALGDASFYIAEALHGKDVYKQALAGSFQFA